MQYKESLSNLGWYPLPLHRVFDKVEEEEGYIWFESYEEPSSWWIGLSCLFIHSGIAAFLQ